jgi:hypothetical protein
MLVVILMAELLLSASIAKAGQVAIVRSTEIGGELYVDFPSRATYQAITFCKRTETACKAVSVRLFFRVAIELIR